MPSSRWPPDLLRPVTDKYKQRQVNIAEVTLTCGQVNAVRSSLQGWRHAVKDCATVRLISIERAEGVGVG